MKGYINSIETLGLVDGPGVRVVVFLQGCPLRCIYCHNPEAWEFNKNLEFTSEELVRRILKYKNYFEKNGGVTFSGGEPLYQGKFLLETLKLCKQLNIHTCLDTSGVGGTLNEEILKYVDLVIMDIKAIDKVLYKNITKVEIEKSLEFLALCQKLNKKLWIRQVIVPNINDDEKNIKDLKEFLKNIKNIEKVELLPYHDIAKSKYNNLGIDYVLKNTKPMDKTKLKKLEELLK